MARPLVVDASALLAVVLEEPGAAAAERRLPGSAVSAVNLAEVVSRLIQHGLEPAPLEVAIRRLDVEVVSADAALAFRAARLHAATRSQGLALADCFCLALAETLGAEVLTADRAWGRLKVGVPVTVIR